jgi:hypothetical protein
MLLNNIICYICNAKSASHTIPDEKNKHRAVMNPKVRRRY